MASGVRPLAAWVVLMASAFALATAAVIPQTSGWLTTYSGTSALLATIDLVAGTGLLLAGSGLVLTQTRITSGWITLLAGIAWFAADWTGWQGGIPAVRTLAMIAGFFFLPLVLHLVALQRQPRPGRLIRRLVVLGYALAALLALAQVLFRDPRVDLYCWSNCADDVLLIRNLPPVAEALRYAVPAAEVALGAGVVAVAGLVLARATGAGRRMAASIVIPAALVGLVSVIHGSALLLDPHDGPRFATHVTLYRLRAITVALLAAGVAWGAVRAWRRRQAVMRLAAGLEDPPEPGIVAAIAAEARDPSLEFLFWLPGGNRYVDAVGRPRPAPEDGTRSVLRVTLAGRLIGLAIHDPGVIDADDLDRLLGPAARLALENERLRTELRAKVEEVRASRARIVAAGDTARALAERDLHDGAQQGLLAVMYELRAAARAADAGGDDEAVAALRSAIHEAESLLAELREVAHGLYPAVLADAGLAAALRTLADTAAIPVSVEEAPSERLPLAAERAGYAVVAGAVDAAASTGAEELAVRATRDDDRLVLEIAGLDGEGTPDIVDRISAADGGWSIEGGRLRVWIPCA